MVDWDWIHGLKPRKLKQDDINQLIPVLINWNYQDEEKEEDNGKLVKMFSLAVASLNARDKDLNEALEELQETETLEKENKDLKSQIKKLKKKEGTAGGNNKKADNDEALQVTFYIISPNRV